MPKNIAIVTGGYSGESVISYRSAQMVTDNIDREKYLPINVNISKDGWIATYEDKNYPINKADFSFNYSGRKINFAAAYIALHGTPGEDGLLQAYFDLIGLPYNTSSAVVAAITFDKIYCNRLLSSYGVKVAISQSVALGEKIKPKKILKTVGLPCFVKPNCGGSSIGISKVNTEEELLPAIKKAMQVDNKVVIETFIKGTEITCGARTFRKKPQSLAVTEIVAANEFFDFESKYNSAKTQEITPARISKTSYDNCMKLTEKIYDWLNAKGFIRVDYMLTKKGELYVIEVNTVPGLSKESILPKMAAYKGLSMSELFNEDIRRMLAENR